MLNRLSMLDQIKANIERQFPSEEQSPQKFNPRNFTNFGTGQIALSTTPVQIVGPRPGRICIKITNTSDTIDIYVGNSANVSISNGDLIPAGKGQWVSYETASTLFAVVSSGTPTITWSEVY
jgi:hypothetical protein